jgi:hypothetical protein
MTMSLRIWAILASFAVLAAAPGRVEGAQDQQAGIPPAGGQASTPPPPAEGRPAGPLLAIGWSYGSLIRNGVVASADLSSAVEKDKVTLVWSGPQVTATFGSRGYELGLGYSKVAFGEFSFGWAFRAVGGRTRKETNGFGADQPYVGGEAAFQVFAFRFTAGAVVPVGNETTSHKPTLTGSFGIVVAVPILTGKKK